MSRIRSAGGFQLSISARTGAAHVPYLRRYLCRAHAMLNAPLVDLSLALVDDATISDLHLRFMNIAGPTDVLTFPLEMVEEPLLEGRAVSARRAAITNTKLPTQPEAGTPRLYGRKKPLLVHPLARTGEVVICVPEARRRCVEHGVGLRDELLLYALHGMLHLCGFDDRTKSDFSRMHRKEDEILAALGVGAVFMRSAKLAAVPGDH